MKYRNINKNLFIHELKIWIELKHENIVPLLKVIDFEENLFAIMPYYPLTLSQVIYESKRLSLENCQNIISDILKGLDFVFTNFKIIHQDLKPENILIKNSLNSNTNNCYLIGDWGISNLQHYYYPGNLEIGINSYEIFESLHKMGTLLYMSPERLAAKHSNVQSDIYSLGMIFFYLLFGHLPFYNPDEKILPYQIIDGDCFTIAKKIAEPKCSKRVRNAGEKVYQTHRAKSLPPDCLNVAVRLGFVQRPQVW